ncbi:MAG: carboxylating nicotinate-nucleotide diphosphorylase [Deltaproteobacteria bacterium]|jgi:nicotinate-nucleotide pyrophosphorylase (carboxylating)|nr:carboxylating nicotinate-nucleotide diphosphorylase [Deltaproteobacteria bacterium]
MNLDQITRQLIELALWEDIGPGDLTSRLTVPAETPGQALVRARTPLILSGLGVFKEVFNQVDPQVKVVFSAKEGASLPAGQTVAEITGPARSILTGERVSLNFLMRLSGIATRTCQLLEAMGEGGPKLLDTRKTTPGLRALEKAAVVHGGGYNHRFGLFDGVLIKDNHIRAAGSLTAAVTRARQGATHGFKVEAEVEDLEQAFEALRAGADILLLDNMSPETLKEAVALVDKFFAPEPRRVLLEASGGINLDTVSEVAKTGVDFISVGAITHSAPAADLGLDWL